MKRITLPHLAMLALIALIVAVSLTLTPGSASAQSTASAPQTAQPAQAVCTYTVQYGDTLYSIAARYHISVWQLASMNNLYYWGWIYAGQTLRVPCSGGGGVPCTYRALYVADVTVPDGSILPPGVSFNKVWRVQNAGTCTWGPGYPLHSLSLVGGTLLGAPQVVQLNTIVRPGYNVDVVIPMVAPAQPGRYRSEWKFNVDNGKALGVGWSGMAPLYVDFYVNNQPPVNATRIYFAPGTTSAVVNGIAKNGQAIRYIAGARAGQTMSVRLLGIVAVPASLGIQGADGQVLLPPGSGRTDYTVMLPTTQDYIITVTPTTTSPVNFALQLAIQ